jgi:hypothetical protein
LFSTTCEIGVDELVDELISRTNIVPMTTAPVLDRVSTTEANTTDAVIRVREALSNPKWDFRTVGGIVRDTELSREQVEHVLADRQDLFRQSHLTRNGEPLYTLREKPESFRERAAGLRDFIASPVTYRR